MIDMECRKSKADRRREGTKINPPPDTMLRSFKCGRGGGHVKA